MLAFVTVVTVGVVAGVLAHRRAPVGDGPHRSIIVGLVGALAGALLFAPILDLVPLLPFDGLLGTAGGAAGALALQRSSRAAIG